MTFSCRATLRRPVSVLALLAGLLVPAAADVVAATPAAASNKPPVAGRDISWPNCPKGMGIPSRRSKGEPMPPSTTGFVVIGLTNGPGFYPNPCLADQVAWVRERGLLLSAYAVLSYPDADALERFGDDGPFDGSTALGALRNIGFQQALYNIRSMRATGLDTPLVWLDVEPVALFDWSEDPATFVGNALSPAKALRVEVVDPVAQAARVTVPDYQLSLAIGREGQNARLAARLTGWRIDIRSDTAAATTEHGAGPASGAAREGGSPHGNLHHHRHSGTAGAGAVDWVGWAAVVAHPGMLPR